MTGRAVWTFFYGSYMNRAVLAEVGLAPPQWRPARLHGWDIRIAPRANLVLAPDECVYGVLATATHTELERLYAHAREVLGELYQPEAVLAEEIAGGARPALCYVAHGMRERPADAAYLERILRPARELGFPEAYLARLEHFAPR